MDIGFHKRRVSCVYLRIVARCLCAILGISPSRGGESWGIHGKPRFAWNLQRQAGFLSRGLSSIPAILFFEKVVGTRDMFRSRYHLSWPVRERRRTSTAAGGTKIDRGTHGQHHEKCQSSLGNRERWTSHCSRIDIHLSGATSVHAARIGNSKSRERKVGRPTAIVKGT